MLRPRVLLVDDHEILRKGVRNALGPGIEVCGEARNGEEAVQKVADLQPNVVLMDVSMPRMNGIEATRKILQSSPSTKVVILTMHDSAQVKFAAFKAGAVACLTKVASGGGPSMLQASQRDRYKLEMDTNARRTDQSANPDL